MFNLILIKEENMKVEKKKMMRRVISLILSVSFIVGFSPFGILSYAANYESYSGFSTSEEPILPEKEKHPSLWFDSSQLEELKIKRNGDSYLQKLWNQIENSEFLGKDLPSVPSVTQTSVIRRYYGRAWQYWCPLDLRRDKIFP